MSEAEARAAESRLRLTDIHDANLGPQKYQAAVREACEAAMSAIAGYEESRAAEVGALRDEFRREVDRQRALVARRDQELAEEKAKRNLAAGRSIDVRANETVLRFAVPETDAGRPRDWTVSELEGVAAGMRKAGAGDDTPVEFTSRGAAASVPRPEAVVPAPAARARRKRLPPGTWWAIAGFSLVAGAALLRGLLAVLA